MVDDHFKDAVSLVGKEHFLNNLTPLQITSFVCIDGIIGITLFPGNSCAGQRQFGLVRCFYALTPAGWNDGQDGCKAKNQDNDTNWLFLVSPGYDPDVSSYSIFFQVQWQAVCFFCLKKTKPDSVAPLTITLKTSSSQIIVHHFGYVSSIR